jgi:hypothetical protein
MPVYLIITACGGTEIKPYRITDAAKCIPTGLRDELGAFIILFTGIQQDQNAQEYSISCMEVKWFELQYRLSVYTGLYGKISFEFFFVILHKTLRYVFSSSRQGSIH